MAACRHSPDASGWAGSGLPTSTLEEGGGGECPGSFWNTGLHHLWSLQMLLLAGRRPVPRMDSDPRPVVLWLCDLGRGSLLWGDLWMAEGPPWGCRRPCLWLTLPAGSRGWRPPTRPPRCTISVSCSCSLCLSVCPRTGPARCSVTRRGSQPLGNPGHDQVRWSLPVRLAGSGLQSPAETCVCFLCGCKMGLGEGTPGMWPSPRRRWATRAAGAPLTMTYCDTFVPLLVREAEAQKGQGDVRVLG